MLTNQAKKDFEKWLHYVELRSDTLETLSTSDIFYYLIKWLDAINYEGQRLYTCAFEKCFAIKLDYMSFFDVCKQAIEVCNIQYNDIGNNIK